jgi:serine/threonine protein phosphatase PrpC
MGNSESMSMSEDPSVAPSRTMNTSRPKEPTTSKYTERDECQKQRLTCAVSGMKGWRPTMEDQHLYEFSLNIAVDGCIDMVSLTDHSIFAVFDGHGGSFTSNYLKNQFVKVLSLRPELKQYASLGKRGPNSRSDANGVQILKDAIANTFVKIDEMLFKIHKKIQQEEGGLDAEESALTNSPGSSANNLKKSVAKSPMERSGSTAVVVVMTPHHIICANSGDSRAILRRHGRVLPLSFDHKPSNIVERRRILNANGFVKRKRVDGDLAVSRAFGDFCMKQSTKPPQKVIVDPDFIVYPRDLSGDEFIVLACDGVWDVATSDLCSEFIQNLLLEGETDLGNICEEALDTCLERKSRDNMTIMLIGMPALKADTSSRARLNNALWGQRTTRQYNNLTNATLETAEVARAAIVAQVSTIATM